MKVAILYYRYLDMDGNERTIGGVQTYLLNLAELCRELGWKPLIFQYANNAFEKIVQSVTIVGIPCLGLSYKRRKKKLFEAATSVIDLRSDILLFGADHCSVNTDSPRCISIQHGMVYDLPISYITKRKMFRYGLLAKLKKIHFRRLAVKNFNNCKNRVCVDYNFLNWYRTMIPNECEGNIWVIPNFTNILEEKKFRKGYTTGNPIKILFARRFTPYRGTKIMAEAVENILSEYSDVEFTFAGEGPDEQWLKTCFSNSDSVKFVKYLPGKSLDLCSQHNISVIPSIASEGTSLSVAEAMGAGCIVVASAIGGITNMIIDGYNGILIAPDSVSLKEAIVRLIKDTSLRNRLRINGYETAKHAFSITQWKERWTEVLSTVSQA